MKDILDDDFITKENVPFFKVSTVIIWAVMTLIGIAFKIMHWPGSAPLIVISSAGLFAYSLTASLSSKERTVLSTTLSILEGMWFIFLIAGSIFWDGHPYNGNGVMVYVVTFSIMFSIYQYRKLKKRKV